MPYRSPVADILFSLDAVAGLRAMVASDFEGDFDWETVSSVVTEAGRFATDEIAPFNRPGDIEGARYQNGVVVDARRLRRRLPSLGRGWLGRSIRAGGIRRHGPSTSRQCRLHGNLERRLDGVRPLPASY